MPTPQQEIRERIRSATADGRRVSIDGIPWSAKAERDADLAVAGLFGTPRGKEVLDYLKNITINRVCDASASSQELHFREGARWVVSIILQRMQRGQRAEDAAEQAVHGHREELDGA